MSKALAAFDAKPPRAAWDTFQAPATADASFRPGFWEPGSVPGFYGSGLVMCCIFRAQGFYGSGLSGFVMLGVYPEGPYILPLWN